MGHLQKTFAFVLKRQPWKEFHQVVWLFTEMHGLIPVIGFGMMHFGSQRSSHLDVSNFCEVELEKRHQYWAIRHASAIETYQSLKKNLYASSVLLTIFHVLVKILPIEMPLPQIFEFLKTLETKLSQKPPKTKEAVLILYRECEKEILKRLGYISSMMHIRPEHIRDHLERSEEALELII